AAGYRRVALFGTKFVVESRMFGMLDGIEVLVPAEVETIDTCYMMAVRDDTGGRETLRRIAHSLPVDAIVLAGTDLAVILGETNIDFPHVDSGKEHVRALLREIRATANPATL